MNTPQFALAFGTAMLLLFAYGAPVFIKMLPKIFSWLARILPTVFRRADIGQIVLGGVRLADKDRVRHTHIVGATGSGKTVLMESLIYEDIRRGRGALIIDPKGDREFYDRIKAYCKGIGRESDLFLLSASHIEESARWNPCKLGSASEIQSKLLNAWVFSEPFYEKACQSTLLEVLNAVATKTSKLFLPDIVRALSSHTENRKHIESLFMDFKNLSKSEWGEILCVSPPAKTIRELDFLDITRRNEIVFIDLPMEGKSVESSQIGKLILQEILLISGLRKIYPHLRSKTPYSIYVDEFDAFATESFAILLNKARSSNFLIHIGHQTLSDLRAISDPFMGKILGNTNVRFVFRQDDPVDAETWASFFGTSLVTKSTYRTSMGQDTGDASNRESKEFRIHPDTIKELAIGECIASVKSANFLSKVKIPLPRPEKHFPKLPINRPSADFREPTPNRADEKMLTGDSK